MCTPRPLSGDVMDPPSPGPALESEPVRELLPSLRSPELQREFFSELQGRRGCHRDDSSDSAPSTPISPALSSSSSSPASPRSSPAQSLSSPELVKELRSWSKPLKPVPKTTGFTKVFSGRGSDRRKSTNREPDLSQSPTLSAN